MSRRGRILIVDDTEVWCEELVEILQRGGFHAEATSSATAALEQLNETFYHLIILDIRMDETDQSNIDGIHLLQELEERGLSDATKVIMLSVHGTKELMRTSFREYKVVDFLSKDDFDQQIFLETVRQVFSQNMNINLALKVHWLQHGSGLDQVVLNLDVGGTRVKRGAPLQKQVADELEDLLCRLFYQAKSVLVRPLSVGRSGTAILRVQPFFATGGGGQEVIVKFGDCSKIELEYHNFTEHVQPFIGGGRSTNILALRRTPHLGGLIYSLLGTTTNQLVDFGEFYRQADIPKIKDTLDRLFLDTCGTWYANHGPLEPLDLTAEYQRLFGYTPEKLEYALSEHLKSVQGKQKLYFGHLPDGRTFTNPVLATTGQSLVRSTYICTTHGDFNQHNLLVDGTGNTWLIDFQGTGQSHILRDVSMLDSAVRFQLLTEEEATLGERLNMEQALCRIERFSQVEQLMNNFSTHNQALAKAYATVIHLRMLARRLVEQNRNDDLSEYYIALLYNALNTIRFSLLPSAQREHALLSASLLADQLGLSSQ